MSWVKNYEYYEFLDARLAVKSTFLFGTFCFLEMFGDARGSTFDHSARIRPAIPGLQVVESWVYAPLTAPQLLRPLVLSQCHIRGTNPVTPLLFSQMKYPEGAKLM